MPSTSLVESVSRVKVVSSAAIGLLAAVAIGLGYFRPSAPVAVALAFLLAVAAVGGLRPFADTVAYQLLLTAAFAAFGLSVIVTEGKTVLSVFFAILGAVGVLHYGRRALRSGLWTPVSG
ncbi:hypothetical protein [Halopelagius longus]|uniref:Uncharacterized protein n=1 Tax=Halopelagius longus TaxID=1236180 RepID=A0A1H1DES9_9EURY|nr:hypothetical protein [Halopelagius longus]RDI71303.1 hypothetical protein DWB78_05905 [Halopelagius longus]SDQ74997.1 hypothetical protein SAMN05216278_2379 [Halopelagius longus]